MESQQTNLDVIANNLANVNTTGFKRMKAEFQDMLYQSTRSAGASQGGGNRLPTSVEIGQGSQMVSTSRVFTNGEFTHTGEKLDVAVEGDGFFEVQLADGSKAYTRAGNLKMDETGRIVNANGLPLQGGFQPIAAGTTGITISTNGHITTEGTSKQDFQVQLVRFTNPAGLKSMGDNLFKETEASGVAEQGNPGENGFGTLRQGFTESSNVKVVEEMVNMIMAQRAYEINSKAVQSADEMMKTSNNLMR
jgi:flagellar basal-body rod protein FlgG